MCYLMCIAENKGNTMTSTFALPIPTATNFPALLMPTGFPLAQPNTPDLAALAEDFTRFCDASPATLRTYQVATRRLTGWLAQNGITRPTREDLLRYREDLKATCKAATVNLYVTGARLFFRWLAQNGHYPDIADHLKGARQTRDHRRDCLTSEAVREVLATAHGESLGDLRDFAILALMATCGLRCVEVARANVEDLRTVAAGGDLAAALFLQGKGREDKTEFVKLPGEVAKAIGTYLAARGAVPSSAPLFSGISNHGAGGRMTTRSISRIVKGHFKAAGVDRATVTAHSLRHTAATLALLNGESLGEVQQMLRHANINTTLIYSHAIDRAKSTCEGTVARAIFG